MSEREYWLGFSLVSGIGPVRLRRMLEQFGSPGAAWQASDSDLRALGLDERALASLHATRAQVDLQGEMARLDHLGISMLTWDDPDYPPLLAQLREIDDAPPVLFARGTLTERDNWAVAVVGTRAVSPYGRQVTHQIAAELAAAGLTVVSGLARGVDTGAHRAALEANGRTIAVLGCGLDMVYPPENRGLAELIVQHGALVSPFPLGTQPESKNFPPRNRIMSGLARGVVVVEAGIKSGALLTAACALEQGREVFAVPGNITAYKSDGSNSLIRDGATLVLSTQDILDALHLERASQYIEARASLPDMSENERRVYEHLSAEPAHVDEITRRCGLPVAQVSSALTLLELKGMARQVGRLIFVRT